MTSGPSPGRSATASSVLSNPLVGARKSGAPDLRGQGQGWARAPRQNARAGPFDKPARSRGFREAVGTAREAVFRVFLSTQELDFKAENRGENARDGDSNCT